MTEVGVPAFQHSMRIRSRGKYEGRRYEAGQRRGPGWLAPEEKRSRSEARRKSAASGVACTAKEKWLAPEERKSGTA